MTSERTSSVVLRFDQALARAEAALLFATLTVMLLVMGLVIFSRHFSIVAFGSYTDLGVALIPWFGMLGGSLALRHGRHVGIVAVTNAMPPWLRIACRRFGGVLLLAFLVILVVFSFNLVIRQYTSGATSPGMGLPRWMTSLAVPVGAACAALHQAAALLTPLAGADTERAATNEEGDTP